MSDYLSNLTARTLHTTPVLQPRLASRFEPVQSHGSLGVAQSPVLSTNDSELDINTEYAVESPVASGARSHLPPTFTGEPSFSAIVQPFGVTPSSTARPPLAYPAPVSAEEVKISPLPRPNVRHDQPESGRSEPPSTTPIVSANDSRSPRTKTANAVAGTDEPARPVQPGPRRTPIRQQNNLEPYRAAEPPLVAEDIVETQPRDDRRQAQAQPRHTMLAPLTRLESAREVERVIETIRVAHSREADQNEVQANHAAIKPAQRATAAGIVAQPLPAVSVIAQPSVTIAAPVRSASSIISPPSPDEAGAATPTIQVTIGRIEVRATPSPAPSVKPPSGQNKVMSLDDYLRRRSDGGSR